MRIDEIEFNRHSEYWRTLVVKFESGHVLYVEEYVGAEHQNFSGVYIHLLKTEIGNMLGALEKNTLLRREKLDTLTTQCVLYEIMKTEKVARVLRGKLLGAEYSHLEQLSEQVSTPEET